VSIAPKVSKKARAVSGEEREEGVDEAAGRAAQGGGLIHIRDIGGGCGNLDAPDDPGGDKKA